MNRIVIFLLIGTALGSMLSSWLGPKAISWYFTPPINIGIDCSDAIDWALHKLLVTQSVGSAIGFLVGLALYFLFRYKKST